MAKKIKQLWVHESFFTKIKTEAAQRNKHIIDYTKELCNKENVLYEKKKSGIFPKIK